MYDAIVIGARCAGATTAMLLARAGLAVLLLDRPPFPSEIPHGHFIHCTGRAGSPTGACSTPCSTPNCPPVTRFTWASATARVTGSELAVDDVPLGLGPRRARLDAVLAGAAVAAGAEFRDGFAVDELTRDGEG